jgi:hypothetical protein|tara:strand:- start:173 stop:664 length:492 start_codon:yes stop_codon:yes gene_type:complete
MVITYKTQETVEYPVYLLPSDVYEIKDGVVFFRGKVLDDTNQSSPLLGVRRIQTPLRKNIYPIRRMVFDWLGILKSNHKYFIDSSGMCFTYVKTLFVDLKYLYIKEVVKKERNCILKVVGGQFIIPRPPSSQIKYAGILHNNGYPWTLYNYSELKLKTGRRKV